MAVFIVAAATLRYAQDFFLPLVLAALLSFLLSPLVRLLERWRLGRVGAVLVTAAMAFVLIGALSYLLTKEMLDLARELPKYQKNLIAKVAALKPNGDSLLGRAGETIKEVTEAITKREDTPAITTPAARTAPVEVPRAADSSLHMLMDLV